MTQLMRKSTFVFLVDKLKRYREVKKKYERAIWKVITSQCLQVDKMLSKNIFGN